MLEGLGCVGVGAGLVVGTVWGGWVLSVVWTWFIVPMFGAPRLSIPEAMVVALLLNWLTKAYVPQPKEEDAWVGLAVAVFSSFLTPAFVLAMAWILRAFV